MKKVLISAAVLGAFLFTGCAVKTGNEQIAKANQTTIDQMIVKGKTTKQDIKQQFGDPDKVDFGADGLERWEYSFMRRDSKAINYVPIANWFVAGTNDTKKNLLVLWDTTGVVKNYAMSESKGETKGGLFQ